MLAIVASYPGFPQHTKCGKPGYDASVTAYMYVQIFVQLKFREILLNALRIKFYFTIQEGE